MNESTMAMDAAVAVAGLGWVELATALAGLAATVVALFQRKGRRRAEGELAASERVLVGLVTVVEIWRASQGDGTPQRAAASSLIREIRAMQMRLGSEGDLNRLVKAVEGLVGTSLESLTSDGRRDRAERVAEAYLERRKLPSKPAILRRSGGPWPSLLLAAGIALAGLTGGCALTGCEDSRRWTTETVAAWDTTGEVVVVEWPETVRAGDVWTTETGGRTQSMAWVETAPESEGVEPVDGVDGVDDMDGRPPGE